MARNIRNFSMLVALAAVFGCADSRVGDPCIPEVTPEGAFLQSETYLETSSVQCATRVCIVRNLDGDPNNLQEDGCPLDASLGPDEQDMSTCVQRAAVRDAVYCTCRCDAPAGSSLPTCGCPNGFTCEDIVDSGGDGIRGGYCVRDVAPNNS